MSANFPKVLFVTPHAFNQVTGGGITFSNLFNGWPKTSIATVHNDPEPTTSDVCDQYYVLGEDELDYVEPISSVRRVLRSRKSGQFADERPGAQSVEQAEIRTTKSRQISSCIKSAGIKLLGTSFPERARLSPSLERWIEEYRPEVIYTILGTNGMIKLVEDIADRFELPIVVHFMDDWMAASHRQGMLAPIMRKEMLRLVNSVVGRAKCCLAISPAMKEAYEVRFGRGFEAFQNTIDFDQWSKFAKRDINCSEVADIVYIGSIFPNAQLDALVQCCQAVAELNRSGVPAKLTISSPSGHGERYRSVLQVDPCIEIIETIRDDTSFFQRIAKADLLLLPVNFDEESIRFIQYSMPTKVPAYLTAGGPILVYGPAQAAQVAYALTDGWGYIVDQKSLCDLVDGMREVLLNVDLRTKLVTSARLKAKENHDLNVVRAEFQKRIIDAVSPDQKVGQ
ncbi:MAG: hypothetical protein ACMZ66_16425 [Thalassospira sp.]|uniref:hypothetical protein n=1 Tax=Thalassospira sp. TaxID=1912094 RepID=UPI003A86EAFB